MPDVFKAIRFNEALVAGAFLLTSILRIYKMSQSRQLAAIMFTDIVGYTALMGKDEEKAFSILSKNRESQKPIIEQFGGRWIKELGDGVMASFHTVSDAVYAAIKIQEACNAANDFQLRIGIHLGEVVFENEDVFGDGVNIASRIQAITIPGGIYISESVHLNVTNKKDILTRFIKEEMLKNVKEAISIYEVIIIDTSASSISAKKEKSPKLPGKSIAVLPFINMSNDPEQEYFSDGMAEEILNSLVHLKDLKVAGRISSFQFKGKNQDLREIGEKLGVSTVLEGSVRKQGNRLRVTAQLINVDDGFHLWSEKYDRNMDDIFAIQDDIALAITENLKIILLEKEKDIIIKSATKNNEAYDLYLKGRFFWYKRGLGLKKGLEYFQQAVAIDPDFALAHAGIADSYAMLSFFVMMSPHDAMPKARAAAEKAINADPALVEPYAAISFVSFFYDWNWEMGKHFIRLANNINPNYPPLYLWQSLYLSFVEGNHKEAIKMALQSIELEPLFATPYNNAATVYVCAGMYKETLRSAEKALEIHPTNFMAYRYKALGLIGLERIPEALEASLKAVELSGRHQWALCELCYLYIATGNTDEAEKLYAEMQERSKTEYISGYSLSLVECFLEKNDKAFESIERAIEQRDGSLLGIRFWPLISGIKDDPRFQKLMLKIGFPVYQNNQVSA